MRRAVFLDRDGVLNKAIVREGHPYPPSNLQELEVFPEAAPALSRLKQAGYLLLVVTNQPDVARGTQTREGVEKLNAALRTALPIDRFMVCWHDDPAGCPCRKPKPGLLHAAAAEYEIDLRRSFLIGDRWRDIDAGAAAGCRTALIDYQYHERAPENPPDFQVQSLTEAVDCILRLQADCRL